MNRWDKVKDGGGNLFLESKPDGDEDGALRGEDGDSVCWPNRNPMAGLFSSPRTVDKLYERDSSDKHDEIGAGDGEQDICEPLQLTARDIKLRLPKLTKPDYYLKPDIRGLTNMLRGDPNALKEVNSLIIGRTGYGFIKYSVPINIEGIDICSMIEFQRGELKKIKGDILVLNCAILVTCN